jgi:pyrimidine deaminase RibD-like protein
VNLALKQASVEVRGALIIATMEPGKSS